MLEVNLVCLSPEAETFLLLVPFVLIAIEVVHHAWVSKSKQFPCQSLVHLLCLEYPST